MKKLFYITLVLFLFASCGVNTPKENNSHTHEDGTMHSDDHEHDTAPVDQETFEMEHADTLEANEHHHDHEHPHEH